MPTATCLDGDALRRMISVYAELLRSHRSALNRLNVYPVPDGDTGTNMALTMDSVAAELEKVDDGLEAVCRALSHGSLMGARGNSGVILSQFLRGLTDEVAGAEEGRIDGARWARALERAAEGAYGAVMRPVEGTILTVAREAATAAVARAHAGGDLLAVAEATREAAGAALERTPELLPVLAEAGVVDAGGAGLLLLCDAALHVLDGRPLPEAPEGEGDAPLSGIEPAVGHAAADQRYEVMLFLHADDDRLDGFKRAWDRIGDSIVVVGGDGLYNCHVHTDDIGGAIEAAIDAGRPSRIQVTDLRDQVEEQAWVRGEGAPPVGARHLATAVVAVGAGEGVVRILESLGAAQVVAGGQSMNPSTAEILAAFGRLDADGVVILPNNRNIVPVAEQVVGQVDVPVEVVPTHSIAEGLAALVAYDPEAPLDANAAAMAEAAEVIAAGAVTQAVRAAKSPVGPVQAGDHLGIARAGIVAVAASAVDAATGLLDHLIGPDHEIVTLIVGEPADPADTAAIETWLQEHHPDLEIEVHDGRQPLYTYYVGVE